MLRPVAELSNARAGVSLNITQRDLFAMPAPDSRHFRRLRPGRLEDTRQHHAESRPALRRAGRLVQRERPRTLVEDPGQARPERHVPGRSVGCRTAEVRTRRFQQLRAARGDRVGSEEQRDHEHYDEERLAVLTFQMESPHGVVSALPGRLS